MASWPLSAKTLHRLYVGLTGGFAAGKSSVSRLLHEKFGVVIINVDEAGRKAVNGHPEVLDALRLAFGKDYFTDALVLDRKKMAELVFVDEQARQTLNRIVHPVMLGIVAAEMTRADKAPYDTPYVVVDAALLFELGLEKKVDLVVSVIAPLQACIERAAQRDSLSEDKVLARYQAQISVQQKQAQSDLIVDNSGDFDTLVANTIHLHQTLLHRAEQKNRNYPLERNFT
jgi:dephospho-CoA kinase